MNGQLHRADRNTHPCHEPTTASCLAPRPRAVAQRCTRHYVITLTNGTRVTTKGKPKLQEGSYTFKDARGQPAMVPAGRVREIAPASMANDKKSQFNP